MRTNTRDELMADVRALRAAADLLEQAGDAEEAEDAARSAAEVASHYIGVTTN